ncbi:unnamed protein product, partial [Ectocarpus sp. 13 AM-2016]
MDSAIEAGDTTPDSSSRDERKKKTRHNGVPVVAASVVLVGSVFVWKLLGAGAALHLLVLVLGILLGALFQKSSSFVDGGPTQRAAEAEGRGGTDSDAAAAAAAAAATSTSAAGGRAIGNGGSPSAAVNGQQAHPHTNGSSSSRVPSSVNASGGSSCPARAATASSPLHWVGETMEGSINWLRGNNGCTEAAAEGGGGSAGGTVGNRRRTRSAGGSSLRRRASGDGGGGGGGGTSASAATSPTTGISPLGFGSRTVAAASSALPPLGAGIPHARQERQQRSSVWSRTYGGGGGNATAAAVASSGFDDDSSMDDEAAAGRTGDEPRG